MSDKLIGVNDPERPMWEYTLVAVTGDITDQLNRQGAEGWEAVACLGPQPQGLAFLMKRRTHVAYVPPPAIPLPLVTGTLGS